ncbi:F-box protein-like protein [Tanacetum coccineum]
MQIEIIKRLPVKPLLQFRLVLKPWKSFIDSSDFIKSYGARNTQPHSHILSLSPSSQDELRYISLVDDDIEIFKVQQQEFAPFVVSPFLKQYRLSEIVGKSFGIAIVPNYHLMSFFGFGVCPVTKDPIVVYVICGVC